MVDADALDAVGDIDPDFANLLHLTDDAQHADVEHKAGLGSNDFYQGGNLAVLVYLLRAFQIGSQVGFQKAETLYGDVLRIQEGGEEQQERQNEQESCF